MYFNNVHILKYALIAIIGLIIGRFTSWCSLRLSENKKIFSKDIFKYDESQINRNYIFMILIAVIYVLFLYKFGLKKDGFLKNLDLFKFLILTPMIILAFYIDLKHRIIPNRLTLTIFELGLLITFLYGITNINMVKYYLLGAVVAAALFGIIAFFGRIIFGKEAMGLGDLKFMGAAGLFFGLNEILEVTLLAFIIAAICSIVILIIRLIMKKKDEYVPFGPFLSLSCLICIFIQSGTIITAFLQFSQLISNKLL